MHKPAPYGLAQFNSSLEYLRPHMSPFAYEKWSGDNGRDCQRGWLARGLYERINDVCVRSFQIIELRPRLYLVWSKFVCFIDTWGRKLNNCWLHISDFHFQNKTDVDSGRILDALVANVEKLESSGTKFEGIFLSGDLAFCAKTEEYELATVFLEKLLKASGVEKKALFLVPGNHDVDRKKQRNLSRTLEDEFHSIEYFSNPEDQIHNKLKFVNFRKWYDEFFNGIRTCPEEGSVVFSEIYESGFSKIAIVGLNSAIFSADESDHGNLWIGRKCLDDVIAGLEDEVDQRILMLHHPLDWLNEKERVQIESKIRSNFDLVLHGHLHQSEVNSLASADNNTLFIRAGASYQTSKYKNAASFLNFADNLITIKPITYSDTPSEKWTLDTTIFPEEDGYVGIYCRNEKRFLSKRGVDNGSAQFESKVLDEAGIASLEPATDLSATNFEQSLLVSRSGKPLYVEPRLMGISHGSFEVDEDDDAFPVDDIVSSGDNFLIDGKSEYGLSTLGRRLVRDIWNDGTYLPVYKDANDLPNYRKKLESKFQEEKKCKDKQVLILEDVNFERHEKLVKELLSLEIFDRYIFLTQSRFRLDITTIPKYVQDINPKYLYLWPLSRSDVRKLTELQFDSGDDIYISSIVEKVYEDLLKLCIPLTPSNVIMYLEILYKEGEFQPLNRVNIVERYLSELLRKPSEYYRDSFNLKNKMDLVSDFVFCIYQKRKGAFTENQWLQYCINYKERKLLDFDEKNFLRDLQNMRIVEKYDDIFYFKYVFYYSYFLGRHIAYRPSILDQFLASEEYFSTPNTIEVISGLSVDNTALVKNLLDSLLAYITDFSEKYISQDFDPFSEALWLGSKSDDDKIWGPLQEKIEAGPDEAKEVDVVKSSVGLETRSANQEIKFKELRELEIHMFHVNQLLGEALINADDIEGDLKKQALNAILQCNLISFQIGLTLAPEMLRERIVAWGGIAFVDFNKGLAENGDTDDYKIVEICQRLLLHLADSPRSRLGTQKLGEAHKGLILDGCDSDFATLANFNCILASKPKAWEGTLHSVLKATDKNAYYLSIMLMLLFQEYRVGLNQARDLESLKKLIAFVRAKRESGKNAPGKSSIKSMLKRLEEVDHFGKIKPSE